MMRIFFLILTLLFSLSAKELTINSDDGFTLKGWLSYPSTKKSTYPFALLVHQYGSDHTMWKSFRQMLLARGFAVLEVDLRAHGKSTKKGDGKVLITPKDYGKKIPQAALYKIPGDLIRWLELMEKEKKLDLDNSIFVGSSLGGGSLVPVLMDYEPKALITLSPSAAYKEYKKDTGEVLETMQTPWLILTSQHDFVLKSDIDYAQSTPQTTLIILPGNGHGKALIPKSISYIKNFTDRYFNK